MRNKACLLKEMNFVFFVLIQRNIAVHETKTENLDRDEEEINSEFCVCVCVFR